VIDIPTIDELRETRRRLAEEAGLNVERYAGLLRAAASERPVAYVSTPLLPQPISPPLHPIGSDPEHVDARTHGRSSE
jgi:hypothetical protein